MKNWLSRRSYFAKNVPFPLNNVTPCNKLWSHHYPWKNAFLLTSVLFRLVVRPCWWLFRAILSFFLRRSSVLTFSPRGIQSSMLFSSTGLAFNWVRIQEVSSVTLKTSKPGLHLCHYIFLDLMLYFQWLPPMERLPLVVNLIAVGGRWAIAIEAKLQLYMKKKTPHSWSQSKVEMIKFALQKQNSKLMETLSRLFYALPSTRLMFSTFWWKPAASSSLALQPSQVVALCGTWQSDGVECSWGTEGFLKL